MISSEIENLLNENCEYRKYLYPKGYLLTNDLSVDTLKYPFYGEWTVNDFCGYRFIVNKSQHIFLKNDNDFGLALVGHAYNPLGSENEYDENELLNKAAELYKASIEKFIEYFNNWTGSFVLFIFDKSLKIFGDASGMLTSFYGTNNSNFYCASHTNLIGDICKLQPTKYVEDLVNYKYYHFFGKYLPGDITPYDNFSRVIPNHYVEYIDSAKIKRFFPTSENNLIKNDYEELVDNCYNILKKSMAMIPMKWDKPAISLTGGHDSKTTLSCTSDNFSKYMYYSYSSSDTEKPDAIAAHDICKMLGLKHNVYEIPNDDSKFDDIEIVRLLMEYNSGSIGRDNANDVRKRAFFIKNNDFDVEVKSWVSEVGRAYYHKRFNKKKFPNRPNSKYLTALYKVFFGDKKLISQTNQIFDDFLNKYYTDEDFELISWYDLLFWEFRVSSWNGLVITGEHSISGDITIPYNNRILLQNMISAPLEYRIVDRLHDDIINKANPKIYNCGISVNNVKHTKLRANIERFYLDAFSKLF